MFLNYFLTIALLLSTFFALFSASHAEAGNALIVGASAAVSFTLELLGAVCLWSAVMELLERSGAVKALTRLLAPLLRRLFPLSSRDGGIMAAISENVSANLLGLGNAATPMGIRAAKLLKAPGTDRAGDELCRLIDECVSGALDSEVHRTAEMLRDREQENVKGAAALLRLSGD